MLKSWDAAPNFDLPHWEGGGGLLQADVGLGLCFITR